MLQGTFQSFQLKPELVELEHLHGSSPQLFAALRHSLSRAYHTKDHTKRSKKVRRKSEESPKVPNHQNFTRTSVSSSSCEAWLQEPTSVTGLRPGCSYARWSARSEANAKASSSQTSLPSPQMVSVFSQARWLPCAHGQVVGLAPASSLCSKCEFFVCFTK